MSMKFIAGIDLEFSKKLLSLYKSKSEIQIV